MNSNGEVLPSDLLTPSITVYYRLQCSKSCGEMYSNGEVLPSDPLSFNQNVILWNFHWTQCIIPTFKKAYGYGYTLTCEKTVKHFNTCENETFENVRKHVKQNIKLSKCNVM